MGNTCLYGATGGKLFAEGIAGERFGVRNSGCTAVIEGSGDHTCEYMTGGAVVVLGDTGENFGAGMTGGLAFVYDKNKCFKNKINDESVEIKKIDDPALTKHKDFLMKLIKMHFKKTGSYLSKNIIDNSEKEIKHFIIVKPKLSNINHLLISITKVA